MIRGPKPPYFKFSNQYKEHFPQLIFFQNYFAAKNCRGVDGLLFKMVQ